MQEEKNALNASFKMEEVEGKTPAELLTAGMKAFWATNYKHAVQYLGKSSELLVEQHKDDKHDSLAEVYLFYGKTLLELSREEGDPLGEAVPKEVGMEEEEDSGDDDDDDTEEENKATPDKKSGDIKTGGKTGKTDDEKVVSEKKSTVSGDAAGKSSDEMKDDENKSDDAKASDKTEIMINGEDASSNSAKENGTPDDKEDDDDESDGEETEDAGEGTSVDKAEEEEPTDLQLAWQVLELARLILERRGDSSKAEYADCLITLGEVSLENEVFDCAITDIKSGLKIQQQLYKDDASKQRRLAETCYKLGLAHSTNNQIEDGVKCYEECLDLLKKRITAIEKNETEQDKKELTDITALIPEIEEKITDLKNYKEEAAKSLEAAKEPPPVVSPEKKATDITHLVKRKRKLEEPTTSDDKPSKKPTP